MIDSLRSEYRKVFGLREWWAVALVPIVVGMFAAAIALPLMRMFRAEDTTESDPYATLTALAAPLALAVLSSGLFGALNFGSDFRHNTLATSFLTTQHRDVVIGSKVAVNAAFGTALCLLVEVAALPVLLAFGGDDFHVNAALFAQLGAALIAAFAWSLVGSGLAMLTRSVTIAAVGLLAWYTIVEFLLRLALGAIGADGLARILPVSATTGAIVNADNPSPVESLPSFATGTAAMLVWALVIGAAGWALTRVRDVS
ncbi:hypothetical protein [Rhodococcus sp. NPDC058521]|uniref:hypothetical protein n=1 Tax=Rhodococcus sp. NPDC058521 TaxID=3346536 RepID=UPI003654F137